jgi:putative transposase
MQKPPFIKNNIYHIYNRGVEKRKVFLDRGDHFRFIHDLFEFNDTAPAENLYYKAPDFKSYEVGLRKIAGNPQNPREPRKLLVELMVFCLMPNHFHLLIRERMENGIVTFMQKLGTGYVNYFNKKYERVGPLFQGKFKAALVNQEAHLIHLPYYIHANPTDLIKPYERGHVSAGETMKFLENYKWSSYLDYIGKKNFPSVTQREFITNLSGKPTEYKKDMHEWLDKRDSGELKSVVFD